MPGLKQGKNDLLTVRPDIAAEWDYEKNSKRPENVAVSSNKKAWWICPKGHSYKRNINDRTGKQHQGCPICSHRLIIKGINDFATFHPELMPEWDFDKNTTDPYNISPCSGKKVWWKCTKGHSWESSISHRVNMKSGCPYCSGKRTIIGENDLVTTHPELIKEWNYEKNYPLKPQDVKAGSNKKVWWKCLVCGHEWKTSISHRTLEYTGCPTCKKISKGEDLIKQWLDKRKIKYKFQHSFGDCKNKFLLTFDFYLPDHNILIEYDGKQHYEPVDYFGGETEFIKQVKRDKIKNQYVENINGMYLIRINYKNLNRIDEIMQMVETIMQLHEANNNNPHFSQKEKEIKNQFVILNENQDLIGLTNICNM